MFDNIVLRNSDQGNVTLGAIAEALLFYRNTRLIVGHGLLVSLAKIGALDAVMQLIEEGRLQAVHCEETLGTITRNFGVSQTYDFAAFTLIGHEQFRGKSRVDRIEISLRSNGIDSRTARKSAEKFVNLVPAKSMTNDDYVKGGIINAARMDARDKPILKELLRAGLCAVPGGYDPGEGLDVDYIESELGYFLFSNIDFSVVNARRKSLQPNLEPVTLAYLLNLVLDSRADMHLAAFYGGDFSTTSANSALVQWRQSCLLERTRLNLESRESFSEIVLEDYPSVREIVDSRERSFAEFLKLLDKAHKFKTWLIQANPDQRLVNQYIHALRVDTWADKAPFKLLKYVFSLGMGAADPTSGIVSGAADAFVVDRLIKGWRPNHFVDDRLKPFLRR